MMNDPIILGIESSCDDTSAAIIQNGYILSNVIRIQKIHKKHGGVVPELASRSHQKNIIPIVNSAILSANIKEKEIKAIAFTRGPGLLGSLLVGCSFAKSLSMAFNIPLIGIHHIQAHILVHFIKNITYNPPDFPFLCLTVSGGHTQIIQVNDFFKMTILGQTIDDAAGEAFDKIAKILGLKYPGGPLIDYYSKKGDSKKFIFLIPKIKDLNFSFSGFKTHVLYFIQKKLKNDPKFIQLQFYNLCASIQFTIVKILLEKVQKAVKQTKINRVALSGGVSANSELRKQFFKIAIKENWKLYLPKMEYTTDNAAMIAIAGQIRYEKNIFDKLNIIPSARYEMESI